MHDAATPSDSSTVESPAPPGRTLLFALFAMRLTGQGLMTHTASTSMARYFERGRGKAISIALLGFPAGQAALPPLAVAAAAVVGWRVTWVGAGTVLAVVLVPLAVGGGYTHVIKDIVMLDVFARFGWNPFVYVNPPGGSGIDVVPVKDSWVLSVGVLIHTSPVLQQ